MGVWGPNSEQCDEVADDMKKIRINRGLILDSSTTKAQTLVDARDAALLPDNVTYEHYGSIIGFLRFGYRLSQNALEQAKNGLNIEIAERKQSKNEDWGLMGSRQSAINDELQLIKIAEENGGQLPSEKHIGDGHADKDQELNPLPYTWLYDAQIKTLLNMFMAAYSRRPQGAVHKSDLADALKIHPNRWELCRSQGSSYLPAGSVPAGTSTSGVPINTYTSSQSGNVYTYYGYTGNETLGKLVTKDGDIVMNYEGPAGLEYLTKTVGPNKIITYYKGLHDTEYIYKQVLPHGEIHYAGPPKHERIVSAKRGDDLWTFHGKKGEEHFVKVQHKDGSFDEYEGHKNEEHLVRSVDRWGKETIYTGKQNEEVAVEKSGNPGEPPKKKRKRCLFPGHNPKPPTVPLTKDVSK